jgi:DDE superfamily endonuclease
VYLGVPEDLPPASRAGTAVQDGPKQGPSVDPCAVGRPAGDIADAGGYARPVLDRAGAAPRGGRGGSACARHAAGAAAHAGTRLLPCGHDGTERRIERPQDPTEQTRCDRGKKNYHTVKNVLLSNAALTIFFLSETDAGSTHDQRMADATPYPLPAGSRLLQDLGFLAFTLDRVEIIMPPANREAGTSHARSKRRIGASRAAACALSTSTAASSVAASSTTPAACGRPAFAIASWKSAVRCIIFACD